MVLTSLAWTSTSRYRVPSASPKYDSGVARGNTQVATNTERSAKSQCFCPGRQNRSECTPALVIGDQGSRPESQNSRTDLDLLPTWRADMRACQASVVGALRWPTFSPGPGALHGTRWRGGLPGYLVERVTQTAALATMPRACLHAFAWGLQTAVPVSCEYNRAWCVYGEPVIINRRPNYHLRYISMHNAL